MLVSVESALSMRSSAIAFCGILSALLLRIAAADYGQTLSGIGQEKAAIVRPKLAEFWLAYLGSVFARLMAIGHAGGIALSKNATIEFATWAAVMIGCGRAGGGFITSWLIDRCAVTRLLVGPPLMTAAVLATISFSASPTAVVALLSLIGFSYGSIIAIYRVVIASYFGTRGPEANGKVFTAWDWPF